MSKRISVIMSVYQVNIDYFKRAVLSIHNQTYKNWELIIINDGDCHNDFLYRECIKELSDERIIYILNKVNKGIPTCLNQALEIATGEYIAKMDSDDISLKTRFEHQVKYFDKHPKTNVLGTYVISFGDKQELLIDYNNYSMKYRSVLLFFRNSGLVHPTYMIKRSFLDNNKIMYDVHYKKAQDYRLWVECTKYSKINCLSKIEFLYRRHFDQISTSGINSQNAYRDEIRLLQLKTLVSDYTEKEKALHLRLCNRNLNCEDMENIDEWCNKILKSNSSKRLFSQFYLKGTMYSEVITALIKQKNDLGFRNTFYKLIKFISIESLYVLFYNKTIYVLNVLRKKIYQLFRSYKINEVVLNNDLNN